MKKKLLIILVILSACLGWYLFIKPFELTSSLRYATNEGTIYQTIQTWSDSKSEVQPISFEARKSILQEVNFNGRTYRYQWKIEGQNDSTSEVSISLTEPARAIANKLTIPFLETAIESDGLQLLREFDKTMKEHLENIKVRVVGVDTIERFKYVYLPLKTSQGGKAYGMMESYALLSTFVQENGLDIGKVPFIEVLEWNEQEDYVKYNFGYPVSPHLEVPQSDVFQFGWMEETVGIKSIYNGNYITSDRAWYAAQEYADNNGLQVRSEPIEFFYDNPNFGYREKEWRTEVFLPLIKEKL